MLDERGASVESDFERFYSIDIRDLFREDSQLTPRRLWSLWEQLPNTANSKAGESGQEGWGNETVLLEFIYRTLARLVYVTEQSNSKKTIKPPYPLEWPLSPFNKARKQQQAQRQVTSMLTSLKASEKG